MSWGPFANIFGILGWVLLAVLSGFIVFLALYLYHHYLPGRFGN